MISPIPIASTIILIFGLQAIVLSILLLVKQGRRQSNFLLALVLFFFALISVNIGMATILFSYDLSYIFRYVQLELLFGIGPALYLYTKSITDPDYRLSPKAYIHFLPVILEFIFYRTEIYRIGSQGLNEHPLHPFTIVYMAEQWLGTASISVYVLLSVRILIKYRQWIKNTYSNLKNKSLGWLRIPVFIYSGFWIAWLTLTHIDNYVFQNAFKEFYFLPTFIGLSIITTWIGFKGYMKSQTEVSGFLKISLKTEKKPSNLKEAKLITDLMNTQKPYLNPDLDLLKLSEIAKLNPKITSRIINHDLHMNFYEFVNNHRVEEFKQRLQQSDCDQLTLLGHAYECGFNSKSTFNHIFKKNTGQTLGEYYSKFKN